MLYHFLKIISRIYLKIHFNKIWVTDYSKLQLNGPLILASNHPNSFLDAILLGTLFRSPVHFMVRGDVFKKRWISNILKRLHMHPIHRLSEGRENLNLNEESFLIAAQIVKSGGILLIFSEGICVHEWRLRPLKKGTARIAQILLTDASFSTINLLPVGLNYSNFDSIGESVYIKLGDTLELNNNNNLSSGMFLNHVNKVLYENMEKLVWEKKHFLNTEKKTLTLKVFSYISGFFGLILYLIPLILIIILTKKINKKGVFYDSILYGLGMFVMPLYTIILATFLFFISKTSALILLIIGPFLLKKAVLLRRLILNFTNAQ